jgi:hypothetical protein
VAAFAVSVSVAAYRAIAPQSKENCWKKLPPYRSKRFDAAMMLGMQASEKSK